jgi:hypothetical protein
MKLQTTVEDTDPLDNENHFGSVLAIMNDIVLSIIGGVVGVLLVILGILDI